MMMSSIFLYRIFTKGLQLSTISFKGISQIDKNWDFLSQLQVVGWGPYCTVVLDVFLGFPFSRSQKCFSVSTSNLCVFSALLIVFQMCRFDISLCIQIIFSAKLQLHSWCDRIKLVASILILVFFSAVAFSSRFASASLMRKPVAKCSASTRSNCAKRT